MQDETMDRPAEKPPTGRPPRQPDRVRKRPDPSSRAILLRDVIFTTLLPVLALIAWGTPRRVWPWIARLIAGNATWLFFANIAGRAARISRRFHWPVDKSRSILSTLAGEQLIWLLEIIAMNRPGAKPAPITVDGADGPLGAVQSGRGAILWWSPSAHRDLVAKIGLAEAGLQIVHLSRPGHGISSSRYGRKFLNPLITRQEMRWLKDRAVIDPKNPVGATLKLRKELRRGGCVALAAAVSRHRGASTPIKVNFLTGRFGFAPGAATLAEKSGAGLFPVATIREGDGYRVIVGPDLNNGKRRTKQLVRAFARWNETPVDANAGQWTGWLQV